MTQLKVFTNIIENEALEQLKEIKKHPMFQNETIRIMPDVHAGMGCVIGFTSTNNTDKIIPNLIGVDIGCGMLTVELGNIDIDLAQLDNFIYNNIKSGFNINTDIQLGITDTEKEKIKSVCNNINDIEKYEYHLKSIGTLGGGNHFIEVSIDKENNKYLIIHSGSRNFGHKIASYYQNIANEKCDYINKDLRYLENEDAKNYLSDMKIAQEFASLSRKIMATKIVTEGLNIKSFNYFQTIHNYIDDNNIIRKGAISAKKDEIILIPVNMKDGSILAKGKGNKDWNESAPHGAGRLMSRTKAKHNIDLEHFKNQMQGIYTSSVCKSTLDEAPDAYKSIDSIINNISETADIIDVLKPIYNFKAH